MTASPFVALGVTEPLVAALAREGIHTPTPVQSQAIPILVGGGDLVATAPTGTGKTAAFLLPALGRLSRPASGRGRGPRILVLAPTRELAQQVSKAARAFSCDLARVKTVCVTGGESYRLQNRVLEAPHEVLVATPGRLLDQMGSGRIDFSRLEYLVLDEADRMLDLGFADDVLEIARALPAERQTVCFTATLSPSVRSLAGRLMRAPQWLEVAARGARNEAIAQHAVFVDDVAHKHRLLRHWLGRGELEQAIVFTATKKDAEELAAALDREGESAVALHGDLVQRQRTRMLDRLRRGEARVLVATDVAARGLDVPAVTHVFNFDLPRVAEDYVHRIGRTGRAGASGTAVSFIGRRDLGNLRQIERFIGAKVNVTRVEGLEARFFREDHGARGRPPAAGREGHRSKPAGGGGWRAGKSEGWGGHRATRERAFDPRRRPARSA